MNKEINLSELTEFHLEEELRRTRQEDSYVPLKKVAEIIKEVFDEAEIEALKDQL